MLRASGGLSPPPPPCRGREGEEEVWMLVSEGAFLTVPKIKGLTFLQCSNGGGRVTGSWIRWFTNVLFFPVQVVLPSASGFWNGVFVPLKVSDLYFSKPRRCQLCNSFIRTLCFGRYEVGSKWWFWFLGLLFYWNQPNSDTLWLILFRWK